MQHASFEIDEILYDIVHNREVQVKEHVENPTKVFVHAIKGPETYTIEKRYLFTGDEIGRALGVRDARKDLEKSREYRNEVLS